MQTVKTNLYNYLYNNFYSVAYVTHVITSLREPIYKQPEFWFILHTNKQEKCIRRNALLDTTWRRYIRTSLVAIGSIAILSSPELIRKMRAYEFICSAPSGRPIGNIDSTSRTRDRSIFFFFFLSPSTLVTRGSNRS